MKALTKKELIAELELEREKNAELTGELMARDAELYQLRKFQGDEVAHDCQLINLVKCRSTDGYSVVYDRERMGVVADE